MKLTTVVLFVLGLLIGGGGVYYWHLNTPIPAPSLPLTKSAPPVRAVSALGRIQPYGGVIAVGVTLPDQLAKLGVKDGKEIEEGQEVEKGDILAELASHGDRQMELDLLDAQIKEAEQKLKEIERTGDFQLALDKLQLKQIVEQGPLDIDMQKRKVDVLKKQADQAREDGERLTQVVAVSKQEKDQQQMLAQQSQAEYEGAKDLLQKLKLGNALSLEIARAKMDLATATLERTRKEVPLASLRLQRNAAAHRVQQTFVKAPSKGKILQILARPGELVGAPHPIIQLADVAKMAVIAEVYETDIHKVFKGQRVQVSSKVDSAKGLTGTVEVVGGMVGKNRVYDADPLADVDRRVVEVKILLDQPDKAAALINLQVNVDFLPR